MLIVEEAINNRRSIRQFSTKKVSDAMIKQILEAGRLAPSAGNSQPWRFTVVKDLEIKKEIRRICWNQQFIEEAPVVIVCFGDLERYLQIGNSASRYYNYLGASTSNIIQDKLTFLAANTVIAIEHMILMATALGLGSILVGGFGDASEFNRLFKLADNFVPVGVVPIGYSSEFPEPRPRRTIEDILIN